MTVITDTWRQLVRRRLWPVALLLVAALVAVPLKLSKTPAVAPAPASTHSVTAAADPTTSYVTLQDQADAEVRRRVLGAAKDPFAPAPLPKASKASKAAKKKAAAEASATPTPTGSGTASAGSGSSAPAPAPTAVPTPTPTPAPTYPLYSIKVRFGKTDGTMRTETLERNKALPSAVSPVFVYLGVKDGGKTAIFLLTGDVVPLGDGRCLPSPTDCQTLDLGVGDTEFLTVSGTGADTDAQYELDLTTIHTKTTTDAKAAAKASAAGTKLLATQTRRKPLRYSFDAQAGTVKKLDPHAYAELLRTARHNSL
jgi:hypothetical protein